MSSSNVCHRSGELILPPEMSKYNRNYSDVESHGCFLLSRKDHFGPGSITGFPDVSCSTLARCVMVPMNVQPWKKRAKVEAKNRGFPKISLLPVKPISKIYLLKIQ